MAANQLFADWVTGDLITADKLNQMKNDLVPWAKAGVADGIATLDGDAKIIQRLAYEGAANGVAILDADGMAVDKDGRKIVQALDDDSGIYYTKYADGTMRIRGKTSFECASGAWTSSGDILLPESFTSWETMNIQITPSRSGWRVHVAITTIAPNKFAFNVFNRDTTATLSFHWSVEGLWS